MVSQDVPALCGAEARAYECGAPESWVKRESLANCAMDTDDEANPKLLSDDSDNGLLGSDKGVEIPDVTEEELTARFQTDFSVCYGE